MKGGTGLNLSLLQYKQDVIPERIIPSHQAIEYCDLSEDKVCSLPTCSFSFDSVAYN